MNKELLLRVKAHILEEPRRLNMSNWIDSGEPGTPIAFDFEDDANWQDLHVLTPEEAPPCGTVACIAGWSCILGMDAPAKEIAKNHRVEGSARQLLDISPLQKEELFYPYNWPNPADYEEYRTCGNAQQRAQVVARVIDAFIAKYEEEAK